MAFSESIAKRIIGNSFPGKVLRLLNEIYFLIIYSNHLECKWNRIRNLNLNLHVILYFRANSESGFLEFSNLALRDLIISNTFPAHFLAVSSNYSFVPDKLFPPGGWDLRRRSLSSLRSSSIKITRKRFPGNWHGENARLTRSEWGDKTKNQTDYPFKTGWTYK